MVSTFYMPVKIISGPDCVRRSADEFGKYGRKAYIVTVPAPLGRSIGALDDVLAVLDRLGIAYGIFDGCVNSPDPAFIDTLRADCYGRGYDFVVGIGGGAVIDIAKAAAVLCGNDQSAQELFANHFPTPPLPILAIPTTAGTGSEASYNSVVTVDGSRNKKSFGDVRLHARAAFLDAKYTEKLPLQMARNTAVDAFTHAMEGFLSTKSTPTGAIFARETMRLFGQSYQDLLEGNLDYDRRMTLLRAANYGGITLAQERTLGLHALSYPLTAMRGVHHGVACGVNAAAFLEHCQSGAPERTGEILSLLGLAEVGELYGYLDALLAPANQNTYTGAELQEFVSICAKAAAGKPNPVPLTEEDILAIYRRSLKVVG